MGNEPANNKFTEMVQVERDGKNDDQLKIQKSLDKFQYSRGKVSHALQRLREKERNSSIQIDSLIDLNLESAQTFGEPTRNEHKPLYTSIFPEWGVKYRKES